MVDFDKILKTQIPDIASIYGGVRGRTMASRHQFYAWPVIVEAGVKLVIDLRNGDSSDRLPHLCSQYGIAYFNYPVDNDATTIAQMVTLFPEFCEKIDQGDFYIACAMGLHRTDVALSTYWVFHAANNGVAPPPICGYRKEKGLNTNKIMRVLNAFYRYISEKDGKEPMPIEVFKERKKTIVALGEN